MFKVIDDVFYVCLPVHGVPFAPGVSRSGRMPAWQRGKYMIGAQPLVRADEARHVGDNLLIPSALGDIEPSEAFVLAYQVSCGRT
jgi:hypothetical protein